MTGAFAGSFEITYADNDIGGRRLVGITLVGIELEDAHVRGFLNMVPVRYKGTFAQDWGTDKLRFAVVESEVTFEEFWNEYRRKVNPARCKPVWNRLSTGDRVKAIKCIAAYFRYLDRNAWRNKSDPETWLGKKMWETEWDNL